MVNKGRQPIKVKVGSTVTIPCKIQNKNTLLDRIWDPHSFNSFVCLNFIRLFEWTTEIVDKIVSQGGQTIKVKVGDTVTILCKIQNKGT